MIREQPKYYSTVDHKYEKGQSATQGNEFKRQLYFKKKNLLSNNIFLASKQKVYGYIIDQMNQYYKNSSIDDLDYAYLRSIKKTGYYFKQDSISQLTLQKLAQSLIFNLKGNLQIKEQIQSYRQGYQKKYKKQKRYSIQQKKPKILIKQSIKKGQLVVKDQSLQKSTNLLSPKINNIFFEKRILSSKKKYQRIQIYNTKKSNLQFPLINKFSKSQVRQQNLIVYPSKYSIKRDNYNQNPQLFSFPPIVKQLKNIELKKPVLTQASNSIQENINFIFDQNTFKKQLLLVLQMKNKKSKTDRGSNQTFQNS